MNTHPTALVIGAGLGGIATAARLARAGFSVRLLEKNATPGGRCSQIIHAGHRFDVGATLLLMPEIFAQTYTDLGKCMEDYLDLRRIDPTYQIRFEDGVHLTLTSDLQALQAQLESIEPGSFGRLLPFLAEGRQAYHLCVQRFVGRNFCHWYDYFSLLNLPLLFQLHVLKKHYHHVSQFFHDSHLRAAFTFQNMYLGLSPFEAPATYTLLQYTELADGVWLPMGGIYRVVESLVQIATEQGVQFQFNTPVTRIVVAHNRAIGVEIQDGSMLQADVIVANADLPYIYSQLLPDREAAQHMDQLHYTCSTLMFYWGVDTVYPQLGTHNVFLANAYRASFERIFREQGLPEEPSFYVYAPARTDPSAAPAGEDTLMVLLPCGHLDARRNQDWEALLASARQAVLHRLAQSAGMDDLEQHLKFELSCTPRDWASIYHLARGAAFGLSHNVSQVGYLRPHNRHPRYSNLYFVGSSTHPGTGMPMALLSARLTTERVLQDLRGSSSPGKASMLDDRPHASRSDE